MTTPALAVDVSHYAYRVAWSPEDREFVATCTEFPSLSWLATSQVRALRGLETLLSEVLADMAANGEAIPEPLSERSYSGRFNLRVPPRLHQRLAMQAAEEQVSLNQYIVRRLSESVAD